MAIYNYRKFKVSLQPDSKKTQGLRTGDIVRRQYFDGKNLIYSLMCVLSYGTEETINANNEIEQRPYFIGALLEGDVPKTEEILDFARVTNLFDQNRSGALYLTGSDEQSPYMDVIDGIGRNESLCWPENIASKDYQDSESQYIVKGGEAVSFDYQPNIGDNNRVVHIKRNSVTSYDFIGLEQDFYKYVANPNRVLVSYKVRASKTTTAKVSLGYQDETRTDGEQNITIGTDWSYQLHAITIDYSGRYLRKFKMDLGLLSYDAEVWVADFNIILLSSVSNFGDASKMRVGKLDGVNDPVFGTLQGYGGYMQKLFASQSAHISGTLTAGDEHGFAATFYAGKIHRNTFINSIDIDFTGSVSIDKTLSNPTGIGNVYVSSGSLTMNAQGSAWYQTQVGKQYTFSFWAYVSEKCQLSILQNNKAVGTIQIPETNALQWIRHKVTFEIQSPESVTDKLVLGVSPTFSGNGGKIYFTSPQLESGDLATQYQPTDAVLNYTNDYGAWFNRGGIGGTIQNPLLQLNFDGEGSIGTKSGSLLIKTDGSGHFANKNIQWNKQGDVTFGKNVTMSWDNLDESVHEQLVSKSVKITGSDTFTLVGDLTSADPTTKPSSITLTLEEENFESTSSQRQWYYLDELVWKKFDNGNGRILIILPFADYWNSANNLTVKCEVNFDGEVYSDTFTLRKQYIQGFTIEIVSEQGKSFKNGNCQTVLTANLYYQGKLVDPAYAAANYTFRWQKFHLPDMKNEVEGWADGIDTSKQTITLDYLLSGQDAFKCDLLSSDGFPYEFPIIF